MGAGSSKYLAHTSPDAAIDERYVDLVYQPITDTDGCVVGILVQGVDVTARAAAGRQLGPARWGARKPLTCCRRVWTKRRSEGPITTMR